VRRAKAVSKAAMALPGFIVMLLLWGAVAVDLGGITTRIERATFDWLLVNRPIKGDAPAAENIRIVDIDRAALEAIGPWPWPRERQAELIRAVAEQKPLAIGIDIAWLEPDGSSPAALARRLAKETGRADLDELSKTLIDGDQALADALAISPSALGLLVEPEGAGNAPPPATFALEGKSITADPWRATGALGPGEALIVSGAGFGMLSLPQESDGLVRFVPLLVATESGTYPGLALETLRLAEGASVFLVNGDTQTIEAGTKRLPLGERAEIQLQPSRRNKWAARTISAADFLVQGRPRADLAGRIVLIGGSAPELGGLRATAADAAVPTLQIQADALTQLVSGALPLRPENARRYETGMALLLGLAGCLAGFRLAPLFGLGLTAFLGGSALAAGYVAFARYGLLFSPLGAAGLALTGFVATALGVFVRTRAREAKLRQRFAERLAPDVVERIIEDPSQLKLDGAARQVTILFTDIEGFTALTERIEPAALIALLDRYMDKVGGLIVAHGGMVDKIVGDAVHAIFNAPLDLADHPIKAIRCAEAILLASAELQASAEGIAAGLGRTRIGIETGRAIVGDVGGAARLDYTAHGTVINVAARLEAANKELGSSICIGPAAREAAGEAFAFTSLGTVAVRGIAKPLEVYTLGRT
jgi:adenylate cyclase